MSDIEYCDHCNEYDDKEAHDYECPIVLRAEIARLTAELARVTECYSESHAAVGQLTRDIDAGREIDRQNVAEVNRLTAELAAARAVPADVEAAILGIFDGDGESLDRARTAIARAISDATAARGTVGGLLATAPVARPLSEWHDDHGDVLWWVFPIDEPPYCGSPLDDNWPDYHTHWTPIVCPDDPGQRDPLPKGG